MELAKETPETDQAGHRERAASVCWHIITGEYPPQPGGVADHSLVLATGLAEAGAEVHVWSPAAEGPTPTPAVSGVTVHRCAGRWSPADLARLGKALDAFALPRRLLVQYAPNAWGYRGMNLGFCRWLGRRRASGDDVRAMIHEPFYPFWLRDKPTRWLLAACHHWMFRTLLAASSHVYVAIPFWEKYLRAFTPRGRRPVTWLPVPSNIPVITDPAAVADLKRRLAPSGELILGSFGTFQGLIRQALATILPPLLVSHPQRVGLLLGRNGDGFAAELQAARPELAGRLVAPGGLDPAQLSLHLQACDVLVQPYPEGVNTRRSSVMAGLAHGKATVTTQGIGTEPIWSQTGCVALVPADDHTALVGAAESLLADADARARLGTIARETYRQHFDVQRSVEKLMSS